MLPYTFFNSWNNEKLVNMKQSFNFYQLANPFFFLRHLFVYYLFNFNFSQFSCKHQIYLYFVFSLV